MSAAKATPRNRVLSEGNSPEETRSIYDGFYGDGGWSRDLRQHARSLRALVTGPAGWTKGDRILELGCGMGDHAGIMHSLGLSVTAVDLSPVGIASASKRHPGPSFVTGDLRSWEPENANFDGIYVRGMSMYHYEQTGVNKLGYDVPNLTRRFFGWLKPGGVFVLQIVSKFDGERPRKWVHHPKLSEYRQLFSSMGTVVRATDWRGKELVSDRHAQRVAHIGIVIFTRRDT